MAVSNAQLPDSLALLALACERLGYTFSLIDTFSAYLAEVSNGSKCFLAGEGLVSCYPLNSASALAVAKDKAHTYSLLRHHNIAIPHTGHFFITSRYSTLRPKGREFGEALDFADQIGYPVFVKPNSGGGARNASIAYERNTLIYILQAIAEHDHIAIIQEYLTSTEYRFFAVDGEIEFGYSKRRPVIIGDGTSTIRELLAEVYNPPDVQDDIFDVARERFLEEQCAQKGLILDSVLPSDETLVLSPTRRNVLAGGPIDRYFRSFSPKTRTWIRSLASIVQLRVMGIDLFAEEGIDDPSTFKVIEVNGTPFLSTLYDSGRTEEAISIWDKILQLYFG